MSLNAENEAERKKFSLYRECKDHNWMRIDSCTTKVPTRCPKCEIERLQSALRQIASMRYEPAHIYEQTIRVTLIAEKALEI